MQLLGIDIGQIADLTTQVANMGALHSFERVGDELLEMIIAIAIVGTSDQPST